MSLVNREDVDPRAYAASQWVSPGLQRFSPPAIAAATANCISEAQAITLARTRLCAIGWNGCPGTDAEVKAKVLSDHTLFVGTSGEDVSIRCALGDPLAGQDCSNCDGGGGGGDNMTMLLLVGAVAVGGLAFLIASQGKKKIIIARER